MHITKATYLISSPTLEGCPKEDRPEFAFIGRSNVGKSSLINMLCDNHKLAKTSGTPGKTQMINHFEVQSTAMPNSKGRPDNWYLVDLPGFGFAKVSQNLRKGWTKMIEEYLTKRKTLKQIFILIDSRHGPQKIDLDFVNQLGEWSLPFTIVFTKTDKSTQKEVAANIKAFATEMLKVWEELPPIFASSAVKKTGRKEIFQVMDAMLAEFVSAK